MSYQNCERYGSKIESEITILCTFKRTVHGIRVLMFNVKIIWFDFTKNKKKTEIIFVHF